MPTIARCILGGRILTLKAFKQQCERLLNEAEDDDERNAYREILQHMEIHRIRETSGLVLDLAYQAQEYDRRAAQVRQAAPLSMIADTLETKARVYRQSIQSLGGIQL